MNNTPIERFVQELKESSNSELDERVRTNTLELRRVEAELAIAVGELDRRRSQLDDGQHQRNDQAESP